MRIAVPEWQGRIAPVFDAAGHLLLVDVEDGHELRREAMALAKVEHPARAAALVECGVDLLICGAISAPLQLRITAAGVRVVAFLCGAVDEVLAACWNGTLADPGFAMPGCRRWRRPSGEDALPAGFEPGRGRGPGQGNGRGRGRELGGQGWGFGGGAAVGEGASAMAAGACSTCPQCGAKRRRPSAPDLAQPRGSWSGAATSPFEAVIVHSFHIHEERKIPFGDPAGP